MKVLRTKVSCLKLFNRSSSFCPNPFTSIKTVPSVCLSVCPKSLESSILQFVMIKQLQDSALKHSFKII
jgi:hypothetical protein